MNLEGLRKDVNQMLDNLDLKLKKLELGTESGFVGFPSLSRYSKETVYITEKIDGTNAQIFIDDLGSTIICGSRNRWITPSDDNAGFAHWVEDNKEDLLKLGPGRHFGEWYGSGIQRGYGLKEKRFALFNSTRYDLPESRPVCCGVVPTLKILNSAGLDYSQIMCIMAELRDKGSMAVPGYMNPEGIVMYFALQKAGYKMTFEGDKHKWEYSK